MNKSGLFLLALLLALPLAANAQIYKWKDKDGTTRYSDTPPLGNVPYESLSGKKTVPTELATDATMVEGQPAGLVKPQNAEAKAAEAKAKETSEQIKQKQKAEEDMRIFRQKNCALAKANLHTYEQGGRISQMSETGERKYLDDEALNKGKEQALKDIAEFCD